MAKQRIIENLAIESVGDKGKGIGRHEGKVIFVEGGVPGDIADVFVYKNKRDYGIARYEKIKSRSDIRTEPFCKHFEHCGGCKWQHVQYQSQLAFKQQTVTDAFQRIGGMKMEEINPIMPSRRQRHYRNKLEFTFSENRWLTPEEINSGKEFEHRNGVGFHVPGAFDKVLDIDECWLQPPLQNDIRNAVREYALAHDLSFFNIREQKGWLRNLLTRNSRSHEWMVILSVFYEDEPAMQAIMDHLHEQFPQVKTLLGVVNPKKNDTLYDLEFQTYYGDGYIIEEMDGVKYRIGPLTFFQTNPDQAEQLYRKVRDYAQLKAGDLVYDLYAGTGAITLYLANDCRQVVGIESIPEAVAHATDNARLNGISNCAFTAGDMRDVFKEDFISRHGQPDVVITDPPRAGMHEKVTRQLLRSGARRIVYVSCNPATQARDVSILSEEYNLVEVQPVDMFPHTYHVENIAVLDKK